MSGDCHHQHQAKWNMFCGHSGYGYIHHGERRIGRSRAEREGGREREREGEGEGERGGRERREREQWEGEEDIDGNYDNNHGSGVMPM